jgi:hypothetical protein
MTDEQFDLARWIQDVTARSLADQRRAAERYNDLLQRMQHGELDEQQVRDEFLRFARDESAQYARDLAQLSLNFYTALLDLGRAYNDRFFDQVLHGRAREAQAGNGRPAASGPRQVTLDLRGAAGQEATAGFVIENRREAPADITFMVADFVDAAGGSPFRPPLQIQPAWLNLGPHAEAGVTLRLPLPPELFVPGHNYHTKVVVHGYDDLELLLNVNVEAPGEPATRVSAVVTPPPEPPPPATPGPKKRGRSKDTAGKSSQRRGKQPAAARKARGRSADDEPAGAR